MATFPAEAAWDALAIKQFLEQASTHALGGFLGDRLLSFALLQVAVDTVEILTLATVPDHQREGLAEKLLRFYEAQSPADRAQTWLLDVAEDNRNAIAFYKKLGFQVDGRRREYYKRLEGQRIDAILMSKPLAGQATT